MSKRSKVELMKKEKKSGGFFSTLIGFLRVLFPPLKEWKAMLPAFGLALLSAFLLRLAYQPVNFSFLAFVALIPLFYGIRRCSTVFAFWAGLVFGTAIALSGVYWFVVVDRFNSFVWLGILPLAVYIGLHLAIAVMAISWVVRRVPPEFGLVLSGLIWAAAEYWLGIGALAMPYGIGQSMAGWISVAQIASIGGIYLISTIIVMTNLALFELTIAYMGKRGQLGATVRTLSMAAIVILSWWWGRGVVERRVTIPEDDQVTIRVALLQPNIDQELKYESYKTDDELRRRQLQDEINLIQLDLLRQMNRNEVDLIVTPESTFTQEYMDVEPEVQDSLFGGAILKEVSSIATDLRTPIIIGGVDNEFRTAEGEITQWVREGIDAEGYPNPGSRFFGGLWLIRPGSVMAKPVADYRKRQLMPFGETVPYLGWIPGFQEKIVQVASFSRGEPSEPIEITPRQADGTTAEVRLGPSICFEDQFTYIHAGHASRGANLFVNTTNDAWFDGSAGPRWHNEMARWRSIETGVPMVRCTNSGVTSFINGAGIIEAELPVREQANWKSEITIHSSPPKTLITRFGNWFGFLSLLVSVIAVILLKRQGDPSDLPHVERKPTAKRKERDLTKENDEWIDVTQ